MKQSFHSSKGGFIIHQIIKVIQDNKDYLSEIDGLIGDGDHGINMNKGFTMAAERIGSNKDIYLHDTFKKLGRVLIMEIGGSMGPLYGTFFLEMSKMIDGKEIIDGEIFSEMILAGITGITTVGNAQLGDKTLLDSIIPAQREFDQSIKKGNSFEESLIILKSASETGKDSTKDMISKIGRSSRLGERSRGVLDAGATSCNLILQSMADSIIVLLNE